MSIQRTARLVLGIGFLFFLILIFSLFAAAAVPPQKVVFAFASLNEKPSSLFVAKDQGFFEEQGLDPQIVQVRSGPIAISALAAGNANFYAAPATGATLGAMAGGLDAVSLAASSISLTATLWSRRRSKALWTSKEKSSAYRVSAAGSGCLR